MSKRDGISDKHILLAIAPVVGTDNTEMLSAAISVADYKKVSFAIVTGVLSDADATFAVEIRECATSDGSYTAVADADLVGTEALAGLTFGDDSETRKVGYKGIQPYVKISITPTGNNSGNIPIAAIVILEDGPHMPFPNPPV